jgi:hypothetical protein
VLELTTGRHRYRVSEQSASFRRSRLFAVATVIVAFVLSVMAIRARSSVDRDWGSIKVSASPGRAGAKALTLAQCTGDVYIFFEGTRITEVTYYLDDPRGQYAPYGVDRTAPFDLAGTTDNGVARPFRTSTMANGRHSLLAVVRRADGSQARYTSTFGISNKVTAAPKVIELAPASPSQSSSATPARRGDAGKASTLSGLAWRSGATDTGASFVNWRGRPLDVATTFEDDGTWEGTEVVWALETGALVDFKGRLSIAVPMLSNGKDTFEQCAAGAYDVHFRALGKTLKRYGREDSYIRLGWEGNGNWYPWSANGNTAGWKVCFRREVQALRSVAPGVQIDWNMNKDGSTNAVDIYPGDDVVDVIGVDYYSMYPALNSRANWDRMYLKTGINKTPIGIGAWLAFAKSHGKRLSVPEWGVNNGGGGGGGDDDAYVQYMHNFFKTNAEHIAYEAYFNSQCPNFCIVPPGKNPQAAAKYRQLWGNR